jgi:crotonobetainyl-CoA:carnitine CoA-transferase CaiB-like acyl-CoA transferase
MDEFDAAGDLRDPKYEAVIFTPPREGGVLRQEMAERVQAFVATRPAEEVYRRGQQAGLPWAPVRRPEQNLDDPHWSDRGFWMDAPVAGHAEPVRYPGAPYRFERTPLEFRTPAPSLGEHTTAILVDDLSRRPEEVDDLRARGVVR